MSIASNVGAGNPCWIRELQPPDCTSQYVITQPRIATPVHITIKVNTSARKWISIYVVVMPRNVAVVCVIGYAEVHYRPQSPTTLFRNSTIYVIERIPGSDSRRLLCPVYAHRTSPTPVPSFYFQLVVKWQQKHDM